LIFLINQTLNIFLFRIDFVLFKFYNLKEKTKNKKKNLFAILMDSNEIKIKIKHGSDQSLEITVKSDWTVL
jgi:hypothetical protein